MDRNKAYAEITEWLNNSSTILEGMRLHTLYSQNSRNKKYLATHIGLQKKMLPVYLRELQLLFKPADEIIPVAEKKEIVPIVKLDQDTADKLKKEFPKIVFNDLPPVLQDLVFKRCHLWNNAKHYHALMQKALSDENRFFAAKKCIDSIEENWLIWDELNEWHKFNRILGKHPKFKENEFERWIEAQEKTPDKGTKEFMLLRRRARNNLFTLLRKQELTPEQKELVKTWIFKHDIVSAKINEPIWNKDVILDERNIKSEIENNTDDISTC